MSELHPNYGPCDGFGPGGTCSECTGQIATPKREWCCNAVKDGRGGWLLRIQAAGVTFESVRPEICGKFKDQRVIAHQMRDEVRAALLNNGTGPEREARTAERISAERDGRSESLAGGAAAAAGEARLSGADQETLLCADAHLEAGAQSPYDGTVVLRDLLELALRLAHPPSALPAPEPVAKAVKRLDELADYFGSKLDGLGMRRNLQEIAGWLRLPQPPAAPAPPKCSTPSSCDALGFHQPGCPRAAPEPHGLAEQLQRRLDNPRTSSRAEMVTLASDAIAALRRAAGQEGWKLVPVEPTAEMEEAGGAAFAWDSNMYGGEIDKAVIDIYRAMLAAAPRSEKKEGGK